MQNPFVPARARCPRTEFGLRAALVATLTLALLSPAGALAQVDADVAQARRVFAEVNQSLPKLQQAAFTGRRPGASYPSNGKAWAKAGAVQKIEIVELDDSGDVVSEFYYAEGALVFVYEAVKGYRGTSGKQATVNEERLYFRDGRLVKWLSGMASDRTDHTPGSADFNEAGRARLAASAAFVAAARKALEAKR